MIGGALAGAAMNATDKLETLRGCEVLAAADDETLGSLAEIAGVERFLRGQVVFDTGEASSRAYVVASGKLEVKLTADGPLVGFFEPGALFGEYAMFANGVRTARVVAATESILLSIAPEQFQSFLLRCPQATVALLRTAVRRLVRAERSKERER